jgi:PAS domain-containing protein
MTASMTASHAQAAMRQRGYASAIALPLLAADGACLGVLQPLRRGRPTLSTPTRRNSWSNSPATSAFGIRALRDRAARDRAEATLRATTRQLEHLLEASPTVLYALRLVDGVAQTAQVSANIERICGYTAAEALQEGWWEAGLHPDERDALAALPASIARERRAGARIPLRPPRGPLSLGARRVPAELRQRRRAGRGGRRVDRHQRQPARPRRRCRRASDATAGCSPPTRSRCGSSTSIRSPSST